MEDRLDKLLIQIGLVSSRERAKTLIEKGAVSVNGKIINKPGKLCDSQALIELTEQDIPWVSRGALKLIAALDHFNISVENRTCLDLGASTGGFTEVLLSKGANKVYAVDVGHGQLVDKLRQDERVVNLEKTHVRDLNAVLIPIRPSLFVVDVSFISLEKVLPFISPILDQNSEIIALIKPQFEVGKPNLNHKGIVKNSALYDEVIQRIILSGEQIGFENAGLIDSPILGGDGNKEFLVWFKRR